VDLFSALLALLAFAVGMLAGRGLANRTGPARLLTAGDAVAINFNPAANTLRIVPVHQVGGNLYIAEGGYGILAVPRKVTAVPLLPVRKPCFLSVGAGSVANAIDPASLSTLGIASLGLKSGSWEVTDRDKLMAEIAQLAAEERGEVEINPDFQLMIAYDVPHVVKTFLDLMGEMTRATVTTVLEAHEASERLHRLWLERERRGVRTIESVLKWLVLIIIAAGFALAMIFAFRG